MGWLFGGSDEEELSVVGVSEAGKTFFLLSLAYLVSNRGWGTVTGPESSRYLNTFIPKLLDEDEEVPATTGNTDIEIELEKIETDDFYEECDFTISTQDFSGGEFERSMSTVSGASDLSTGAVGDFLELYQGADGLIVLVDVVRGIETHEEFERSAEENILEAFNDQLVPILHALELSMEQRPELDTSPNIDGKPIFIVFTKADVHQMSGSALFQRFERMSTITLQRLRKNNCEINTYTTSAIGCGQAEASLEGLEASGFTDLLIDMAIEFD